MMCKIKILKDKIEIERLNGKLGKLIFVYFGMITTVDEGLDKCDRYDRTIRSFTASDCKLMFEFKKADLQRLLPLLHFPDECCFDNRSKMAGEEVFLRGLYELVSAANKHEVARVFGRDWSAQSRAFKYFIEHIYNHFKHLVMDNLHWWYRNGFFATSLNFSIASLNFSAPNAHPLVQYISIIKSMPIS
jgi:hypothetical protein